MRDQGREDKKEEGVRVRGWESSVDDGWLLRTILGLEVTEGVVVVVEVLEC